MMRIQPDREFAFSPDFAMRVMTGADSIRRRRRFAGYGTVTLLVASAVTAGVLLTAPARHVAPAPVIASVRTERMDVSVNRQTDPLQFLFPDAEPVVQFADDYWTANYGRERRAGEFLFTTEAEQDASDL